jgi:hypothetical protein
MAGVTVRSWVAIWSLLWTTAMCRLSGSFIVPKLTPGRLSINDDSNGLLSENVSSQGLSGESRAGYRNFLTMYSYESRKQGLPNPLTSLRGGGGSKFSSLVTDDADTQRRTVGISALEVAESEHQGGELQNGFRGISSSENSQSSSTDRNIPHSANNDATRTAPGEAEDQPKVLSASEALKAVWRTLVVPPPTTKELQSILKGQHAGYVRAPGMPSAPIPSVDSNGKCVLFVISPVFGTWSNCTVWLKRTSVWLTITHTFQFRSQNFQRL